MDEQNLKSLFDFANGNKLNVGNWDSFKANMQDQANRKSFHEFMTGHKLNVGSYDDFETNLTGVKKKESPSGSPSPDGTSSSPEISTINLNENDIPGNSSTLVPQGTETIRDRSVAPVGVSVAEPVSVSITKATPPQPPTPEELNLKAQKDALGKNIPQTMEDVAKITQDRSQLHQEAFSMASQKKYASAQAVSDILIQKYPDDSYGHQIKANAYEGENDYTSATKELSKAIELDPENINLRAHRMDTAQKAGLTATAREDATEYLKNADMQVGSEQSAYTRSRANAILGNEDQAKYWQYAGDGIVDAKKKSQLASELMSFPDWFESINPITSPMMGIGEGVDKIVKARNVPEVASGVLSTAFGAMGYVNPELALFNLAIYEGKFLLPEKVIEFATAPLTMLVTGGDPAKVEELNSWQKLGLEIGDLTTFGLYFGLMKKGIPSARKLFTKEPWTIVEAKDISKALGTISDKDFFQGTKIAEEFIKDKKDAADVSEVMKSTKDIPTYRIGKKLYTDKDTFLSDLQAMKDQGVKNIDVQVNLDTDTSAKVNDIINPLPAGEVAGEVKPSIPTDNGQKTQKGQEVLSGTEPKTETPAAQPAAGETLEKRFAVGFTPSVTEEQANGNPLLLKIAKANKEMKEADIAGDWETYNKKRDEVLGYAEEDLNGMFKDDPEIKMTAKKSSGNFFGDPEATFEIFVDTTPEKLPEVMARFAEKSEQYNQKELHVSEILDKEVLGDIKYDEFGASKMLEDGSRLEPGVRIEFDRALTPDEVSKLNNLIQSTPTKPEAEAEPKWDKLAGATLFSDNKGVTLYNVSFYKSPKDFEYGIDRLCNAIDGIGINGTYSKEARKIWIFGEKGTAADFSYREGTSLRGKNDLKGFRKIDRLPGRFRTVEQINRLRDQEVIKSSKGKVPITDEEIASHMAVMDALDATYRKVTGKDDFWDKYDIQMGNAASSGEYQNVNGILGSFKYSDGQFLVKLFQEANVSTLAHEFAGHGGRRILAEMAKVDDGFAADYASVKKWAGVKGETWTRSAEEKFARAFERYLRDGKAPTPELEGAFSRMRQWLSDIYKTIKGGPLSESVPKDIRQVFDRMLGKEEQIVPPVKEAEVFRMGTDEGLFLSDELYQPKQSSDRSWFADAKEDMAQAVEKGKSVEEAIEIGKQRMKDSDWFKNQSPEDQAKWDKKFSSFWREKQGIKDHLPDNSPDVTGIKNAVTKQEREARGKDEVEVFARRQFGQVLDTARDMVDSGQMDIRNNARIWADNPRPLSPEESAALIYDRMRLSNQYRDTVTKINGAIDSGDKATEVELRAALKSIEDDVEINDEASRRTGYEQGLGLAIRRMMIARDYSQVEVMRRAKAANGGELSPKHKKLFEDLTSKLEKAEKDLTDYKDKEAERASKHEHAVIAKESRKEYKSMPKGAVKEKIRSLESEIINIARSRRGLSQDELAQPKYLESEGGPIPDEMIPALRNIAKAYIMDGVDTPEGIVDRVYSLLENELDGVTSRDVRDAISGYGRSFKMSQEAIDIQLRDLKRQMSLTSALEDATQGEPPMRSGLQRDKPSTKVRELQRKVRQVMKENGVEIARAAKSPEEQWRSALDAVKTRLRNQIIDLEKQIRTGEKSPRKKGIEYDDEAKVLQAERDNLKEVLVSIDGKPEMSDEQRIQMALKAVEKSIDEYERRIREKDLSPAKKESKTPNTPELEAKRLVRDQLKATYKDMQDAAKPKKTPEEIALQTLKTRLRNRIADMENRLATGDFEKKPRRITPPDQEAMAMQARAESLKKEINAKIRKLEYDNRSTLDRAGDFIVKFRRAVLLSSVKTLGKLFSAASMRQITTPIEEIVGEAWSHVPGIKTIADKATREGHFSAQAEFEALKEFCNISANIKEAKKILKTGSSTLDALFGGKEELPPEALDFFGQIHQVFKNPAKRAEFERSYIKRSKAAQRAGLDTTDPLVQTTITSGAYIDANRSIFMNKNGVTSLYSMLTRMAETKGTAGKATSRTMKILLPIVRVPTNYVMETTSYIPGVGFAKAAAKTISHSMEWKKTMLPVWKGVENLTPDQADYVLRALKKGSVGTAIFMIGYLNSNNIGGYYQPGEKRKKNDVDAGGLRILGINVPKFMLHTPALELLQFGATIARVEAYYKKKHKDDAIAEGTFAAGKGLMEQVPFFEEPATIIESMKSGEKFSTYVGELVKSMIVPPDVERVAKWLDTDSRGNPKRRKATGLVEPTISAIPGLRTKLKPRR